MPQIKDLGNQYFQDLVLRSFFQISSKDESRFVMHDLINDLAQVVAGDICSKLESDKQQKFSNHTRHSSYIDSTDDTVLKFETFNQVKSLRTFLALRLSHFEGPYLTNAVLVDLLPRLGYLRVLSLSGCWITELPDVFENLKHLRYLNFSYTSIECLPNSLCTLYNLETLLLKMCTKLRELPSKMENLVNLQYLDIRYAYLIHGMPFGIDKLTNLQRLSDFIIGEGDGHRMRELKYLSNLKGDFRLAWLENVNCQDAREAKLNEKQGIDRLALHWGINLKKDTRNKEVEEWVLDSLRPPKKLEHLDVMNYGGAKFSTWIADSSFKNLLSLKLDGCRNCKSLPSIARFPLLKNLSISFMHEVHKIGVELFGENQSNAFASLGTLHFENMGKWEEWDPCEGDEQASKFPRLLELSIIGCPQLLGRLPTLQSLQKLKIDECRRLVVSISSFSSLRELRIEWCEELVDGGSSSAEVTSLKYVSLKNISKFDISAEKVLLRFANSETFDISGWKDLESLSQNGLGLVGHRFIKITDCPQLVSLETEEEILQLDKTPVVESLEIRDCERFNSLPEILHAFPFITRIKLEKCPGMVCFAKRNFPPALKELKIYECENLQYLVGENVNNNKSMSDNPCQLQRLKIRDCPSLTGLENFTSLRELEVSYCSADISFPEDELKISGEGCSSVISFPEEGIGIKLHPPLASIRIQNFENLEYMCSKGFQDLTSLQELQIYDCPKLTSLPEKDMLLSLYRLCISGCPLLEERCSRGKRREWSKIAHIPSVDIY
ncbi:hypothetical protein Golax_022877 [Gossypium laxum]|uniref:Uncharacterized protein n=1 Tax=Gossypium laxum TaxID=34288 RepID=A0A7J9B3T9_9ROSI|nr:hypothetical protein [Gossypium laxum]